jgi:DNA-binding IclR family transcriptional regulator
MGGSRQRKGRGTRDKSHAPADVGTPDRAMAASAARAGPNGTQTLMRGLAVVEAVARGARDMKEIGRVTGITRSTTHRLVTCLVHAGYLRLIAERGYLLGPRLIEFGYQARDEIPLATLARPFIEDLAETTGDTVHLGIRDGDEVLYLDKVSGTKGLEMRSRIGHRMPLVTTGMGKALLLDQSEQEWRRHYEADAGAAEQMLVPPVRLRWEEFRERMRRYAAEEFAFDLEENEISIRCVAAPIRDAEDRIVAAVSVSSTVPYMPMKRMRELVGVIHGTTSAISSQLGRRDKGGYAGAERRTHVRGDRAGR